MFYLFIQGIVVVHIKFQYDVDSVIHRIKLYYIMLMLGHIRPKMHLNDILSIPTTDLEVLELLGYGARSSAYKVIYKGHTCAMKYLMQKSKTNCILFEEEYRCITRLRNTRMTSTTLAKLSKYIQSTYSLDEINERLIKELIPEPIYLHTDRVHYYLLPLLRPF